MSIRRIISLGAGTLTSAVVLIAGLGFVFGGDLYAEKDRLLVASVIFAPLVMAAVMIGYGVWWFVLFLLTLFLPSSKQDAEKPTDDR